MKKPIPFLELATQHAQLADELTIKFRHLLKKGIFSAGEEVDGFERNVQNLLKLPSAIACSNGTDALGLALRALEIGEGDEVIVPDFTWVSTAEAVVNVGAKPVFCDVKEDGLISFGHLEKLIGAKTKAVIPVHLYGKMVDMKALMTLAKRYRLKVIEDAAQAFGAFQHGISAGAYGDVGCFSFYPTKNIGALGEAGLMVTHDKRLEKRLRLILNHGRSERNVHVMAGQNSKIDTLQAGFLNVKLGYYKQWTQWRRKLAAVYLNELTGIKALVLPEEVLEESHNVHLFTVRLKERDALKTFLQENGIGTLIHYPVQLSETEAFDQPSFTPMAKQISQSTLSLPLHPYLGEDEAMRVCETIKVFFGKGVR